MGEDQILSSGSVSVTETSQWLKLVITSPARNALMPHASSCPRCWLRSSDPAPTRQADQQAVLLPVLASASCRHCSFNVQLHSGSKGNSVRENMQLRAKLQAAYSLTVYAQVYPTSVRPSPHPKAMDCYNLHTANHSSDRLVCVLAFSE